MRRMLVLVAMFAAGLLWGAPPATAATVDVQAGAMGFIFTPEDVTIDEGDSIRWIFSGTHDVTLDNPPVGEGPAGDQTIGCSTELGYCDSQGAEVGPEFTYPFPDEGVYPYYCRLHAFSMSGTVTVEPGGGGDDTTPPVTTSALAPEAPGPGGTYSVPVEVTLDAADEVGGSGVDFTEYSIDGGGFQEYSDPFKVTTEGAHEVVFRSVDNADNQEADQEVAFSIDYTETDPPVTTASLSPPPGPGGDYIGSVEVTLTADDGPGGSEVDFTEYALDGGAFEEYTDPFTVSDAGDHELEFRSTDNAGNVEATQQLEFTIIEGSGTSHEVMARDVGCVGTTNCWDPEQVEAEVGDEVQWTFANPPATVVHDVWLGPEDGPAVRISPPVVQPDGEPVERSFAEEGAFTYYCSFHSAVVDDERVGMVGTVYVGVDPPPPGPEHLPNPTEPPDEWETGDNEKPELTNVKLRGLKGGIRASFVLSEPSRLDLTFRRGGKKVFSTALKNLPAGKNVERVHNKKLTAGAYKVKLRARDQAGNRSQAQTVPVQIK